MLFYNFFCVDDDEYMNFVYIGTRGIKKLKQRKSSQLKTQLM